MVIFFLMWLLPGHNVHGGLLTLVTMAIGMFIPPLAWLGGILASFKELGRPKLVGLLLNVFGLALYVFWLSGGVGAIAD